MVDKREMQIKEQPSFRFAICVENTGYPASLEILKVYQVLPDEEAEQEDDLRIIDESGEDYLYPASYFVLIELPFEAGQTLRHSITQNLQTRFSRQTIAGR